MRVLMKVEKYELLSEKPKGKQDVIEEVKEVEEMKESNDEIMNFQSIDVMDLDFDKEFDDLVSEITNAEID
jgi:hypothetical protein